jgi:hypothetical protein
MRKIVPSIISLFGETRPSEKYDGRYMLFK